MPEPTPVTVSTVPASGSLSWPAVPGVKIDNEGLEDLGTFKADTLPLNVLSSQLVPAQKLLDRAGYR